MLFSEGFEGAKLYSGKVFNLYKLCSEQLSKQDHYDFGMRAVKSVLVMAGALKRSSPDLSEEIVLIRSLRDSNLPKFLRQDVGLFKGILDDLFPGTEIIEEDFGIFVKTLKEVMEERSLEIVDAFVSRIIQLYQTMKIRHGVMLVGPTGGGKTTNYEVLKETYNRMNKRSPADFPAVKSWVLNPKVGNLILSYTISALTWPSFTESLTKQLWNGRTDLLVQYSGHRSLITHLIKNGLFATAQLMRYGSKT